MKTFALLISGCVNNNLFKEGENLHRKATILIKEFSIELLSPIVNLYHKSGNSKLLIEVCEQFKDNKNQMDINAWNCFLQAHASLDINKGIQVYNEMTTFIEPDVTTFMILLKWCGKYVSSEKGMIVIEEIQRFGLENQEEIISSMINFYSNIGEEQIAKQLFDELKKEKENLSTITYNNMLKNYAHQGKTPSLL